MRKISINLSRDITINMPTNRPRRRRNRYRTGEDIDMLREREQDTRRKRRDPICDTHIDGA